MNQPSIPADPPKPDYTRGLLVALRYALEIAQNRRSVVKRTDVYKAACTDIEISIAAAIERVEAGGGIHSTAVVQNAEPPALTDTQRQPIADALGVHEDLSTAAVLHQLYEVVEHFLEANPDAHLTTNKDVPSRRPFIVECVRVAKERIPMLEDLEGKINNGLSVEDHRLAEALLVRHISPTQFPQLVRHALTGQRIMGEDSSIAEAERMVSTLRLMVAWAEKMNWLLRLSKAMGLPLENTKDASSENFSPGATPGNEP